MEEIGMIKRNRRREEFIIVMDPEKDWEALSAAKAATGIFKNGKFIGFGIAGRLGWVLRVLPDNAFYTAIGNSVKTELYAVGHSPKKSQKM